MFGTFGREVRFALRGLLRDRGFAVTALLSIGLGVGANAAIFSLVDQASFRQLPVRDPERLVLLDWRGSFVGHGWGSDNLMSYPFYKDLRDGTDVFDGVFGRAPTSVSLAFENSAEPVGAEVVTGSYFSVLGVRPWWDGSLRKLTINSAGRIRSWWCLRLLADPSGRPRRHRRAHRLDQHTPDDDRRRGGPGFHGIDWGEVPSLWIPTMMKRRRRPISTGSTIGAADGCTCLAGLKPGMSMASAQAALQPWFKAMLETDTRREDWPTVTADQRRRYLASSLALIPAASGRSNLRGRLERPLLVFSVPRRLFSCCRASTSRICIWREGRAPPGKRAPPGAGRLTRPHRPGTVVQSLILAAGGAALGLLIAPGVIRALVSFLPTGPSGIDLVTDINLRVFGFALGAACATAVLFSLAPAFRAARAHPSLALKEESTAVSGGVGLRKVLVVAQIALALVLLIGAGLFVRTLASLRAKGPGFTTTNTILLRSTPLGAATTPREPRG